LVISGVSPFNQITAVWVVVAGLLVLVPHNQQQAHIHNQPIPVAGSHYQRMLQCSLYGIDWHVRGLTACMMIHVDIKMHMLAKGVSRHTVQT